jgi:hypothetical protein
MASRENQEVKLLRAENEFLASKARTAERKINAELARLEGVVLQNLHTH